MFEQMEIVEKFMKVLWNLITKQLIEQMLILMVTADQ